MKNYLQKAVLVFFVLCILFVPFVLKEIQSEIDRFLFLEPLQFFAGKSYRITDFSSDTRLLNALLVLLMAVALLLSIVMKRKTEVLMEVGKNIVVYYLAFVLLKYGIDKLFLAQFYTPEPNILYTPFGYLSKDILYWSTMGISPVYSLIIGSVEVIAALMLIFKRMRPVGLLLSVGVLVNIVVVNFSFDISVKTFSLLLLMMAIYLSWPYFKGLYMFLILNKVSELKTSIGLKLPLHIKAGVKFFIVSVMLLQILYPYIVFKQVLPDKQGAYSVDKVFENGESIDLKTFPVKRVFIHKNNYIVFQHHDESMKDYFFEDDGSNTLTLFAYDGSKRKLSYEIKGDILELHFLDGLNVNIIVKKLKYKKLPALKDDFHFTVDEVN